MADIFCTSGSVKLKAGSGSTALTGAQYTELINQAESTINAVTRVNYSDTYAALNDDVKKILEETASNLAAIYNISHDMGQIAAASSLIEAEDRIIILRDAALRGLSILRDKKTTDFINGA